MRADVKKNQEAILKAIPKSMKGGKINKSEIARITNLSYVTVNRYFKLNFRFE